MRSASKIKSGICAWLVAMVVTLCLGETCVGAFLETPQPASGVFEAVSPEAIGGNYDASAYDASGYAVAPKTTGVFEAGRVPFQATRAKGTGQLYQTTRRTDIDWARARVGGDKRAIGLSNREAAERFGLAPELDDGFFSTLHHLGQDARGGLVEASTRYHGVGKYGQDILHSQFGRSQPNPFHPINRRAFDVDTREYWKWRVGQ